MLSGPPGIGKTSIAKLILQKHGYNVIEINASDKRSKNTIQDLVRESTETSALSYYLQAKDQRKPFNSVVNNGKKSAIIMDEVDGCSSSDRGGIAQLIKIIKNTKVPIVCVCNDHSSRKIVSLLSHCYDLRLNKPSKNEIVVRIG